MIARFIAGGIVDAVAALFFVQSKRAQESMAEFFDKLRRDRNHLEARKLCENLNRVYFGMRSFSSLGSSASLTQRRSATSQGLALMPCRNISTRSMSSAVLVWQ